MALRPHLDEVCRKERVEVLGACIAGEHVERGLEERLRAATHVVVLVTARLLDWPQWTRVVRKGFTRARDERGWMHVDGRAQPAYARRFAMAEPFYNGQARVERFDGSLEIIDEAGRTMVVLRAASRSELEVLSASAGLNTCAARQPSTDAL
ncbi:hypothetical protein [Sorangium sp. So ce362]|uniref:hypothetical protein n=1 Tax=Sorangium sp. So ce362 TaxID=3133303 RepID=UPI003F5EFE70